MKPVLLCAILLCALGCAPDTGSSEAWQTEVAPRGLDRRRTIVFLQTFKDEVQLRSFAEGSGPGLALGAGGVDGRDVFVIGTELWNNVGMTGYASARDVSPAAWPENFPAQTKQERFEAAYRELFAELESDVIAGRREITALVLSGHSSGNRFVGSDLVFDQQHLDRLAADFPNALASVQTLWLLGCNSGRVGHIFRWKTPLRTAVESVNGAGGRAVIGSTARRPEYGLIAAFGYDGKAPGVSYSVNWYQDVMDLLEGEGIVSRNLVDDPASREFVFGELSRMAQTADNRGSSRYMNAFEFRPIYVAPNAGQYFTVNPEAPSDLATLEARFSADPAYQDFQRYLLATEPGFEDVPSHAVAGQDGHAIRRYYNLVQELLSAALAEGNDDAAREYERKLEQAFGFLFWDEMKSGHALHHRAEIELAIPGFSNELLIERGAGGYLTRAAILARLSQANLAYEHDLNVWFRDARAFDYTWIEGDNE